MKFFKSISLLLVLAGLFMVSCEQFDEFNENPNEPTTVSPDVLMASAIRNSVNTTTEESFLLGNNIAQLSAKTLRNEVDAYNWNAFPTVWEGLYGSLTDVYAVEEIAIESENAHLEGAAIVLRSWIFSVLTNAYGDVPYFEAISGLQDNFTPVYDPQPEIYADLLSELERASNLLSSSNGGSIAGDLIFNGDASKWQKFANTLRLQLLMLASNQLDNAAADFAAIVDGGNIMESNDDNATLTYLNAFPNQFPLIPLKTGDFDAVAISSTLVAHLTDYDDPRLFRYARPDNDMYTTEGAFNGADNGNNTDDCSKTGSRLGAAYYVDGSQTTASQLGIDLAKGIMMTYAEVEFLLAEAVAKGWISGDVESHYRNGIAASMEYHQVDLSSTQWSSFEDFYDNSGVAYEKVTDIWEQKWVALFFHGLQPYFELRRWYHESGMSWDGIPFLNPPCANVNDDELPLRFLYPGQEISLNEANYNAAVDRLGGSNSQNASMWLVQ
ncbi:SusD/RagB family nutrient-binding outer membrane lipoprotein [Phaeodactylibacter xiamenensis]|uniref:SusD/RagB family nutrient-binding outer membrane lipoprotein n=2 Tax=Phaeodactylibacter xiamenensis TaxID=1524460 RepID=UPI003BAB4B51